MFWNISKAGRSHNFRNISKADTFLTFWNISKAGIFLTFWYISKAGTFLTFWNISKAGIFLTLWNISKAGTFLTFWNNSKAGTFNNFWNISKAGTVHFLIFEIFPKMVHFSLLLFEIFPKLLHYFATMKLTAECHNWSQVASWDHTGYKWIKFHFLAREAPPPSHYKIRQDMTLSSIIMCPKRPHFHSLVPLK